MDIKISKEKEKEKEFYKELGKRIFKLRLSKNLNQEHLSEILNLKRPSIVNIEKGNQKISIYNLVILCNYFQIDIKDILPEIKYDLPNFNNVIGINQIDKKILLNPNSKLNNFLKENNLKF